MDTESRSSSSLKMQAVKTWVKLISTGCHIIVNILLCCIVRRFSVQWSPT